MINGRNDIAAAQNFQQYARSNQHQHWGRKRILNLLFQNVEHLFY